MSEQFFYIRSAENTDKDKIILAQFMNELAAYDNFQSDIKPDDLSQNLFADSTNIKAFLAYRNNQPIGFILCYECFTVYHGQRGLYVPGAYIIDEYRHRGYGVKLFQYLCQHALDNNYHYLNWIVEEGNNNANTIYEKMGAKVSKGWNYIKADKDMMNRVINRH